MSVVTASDVPVYDIGDLVRLEGTFTDDEDSPLDPPTVRALIRASDGTLTTLVHGTDAEVRNDSVGYYYVDFTIDVAGMWAGRIESTGLAKSSEETFFLCQKSAFY